MGGDGKGHNEITRGEKMEGDKAVPKKDGDGKGRVGVVGKVTEQYPERQHRRGRLGSDGKGHEDRRNYRWKGRGRGMAGERIEQDRTRDNRRET